MPKLTYKIYTLGCKANQYDSAVLAADLDKAGFLAVTKNAGLAIVNSCAVTGSAVRKDRRMVNKARSENPSAKLVLMGCWPETYPREAEDAGADLVRGTGGLKDLLSAIGSLTGRQLSHEILLASTDRTRYFLKVQDGCEQFCSYCNIPYARGKLRSRAEKEILKEAGLAVEKGFREIVLTGIHLGLYGKEKESPAGDDLAGLAKKICAIKGLARVRLSSIEVTEIDADLIGLMKTGKLCPHLHIPLQSGCDKILKLMNRPYDTAYFEKVINDIRSQIPAIAITTDVIVGFPGETETDFRQTLEFIRETKFSRLHVFSFSAHEKTPASKMSNRVEKNVIAARSAKLRQAGRCLEGEYRQRFKGKPLEIVVETVKEGKVKGKSEYYFEVERKIPSKYIGREEELPGKVIKV